MKLYISQETLKEKCTLVTGMSGVGKTYVGERLAKKLSANFIELDEVMRTLVKKKYPSLKNFQEETLIKQFGTREKAWKVIWEHQSIALKETLEQYEYTNTVIEGMIIFFPESYSLIDKTDCELYVIPTPSGHKIDKKYDAYMVQFMKRYKSRITILKNEHS